MRKGKGARRSGFREGREALRLALPAMAEMGLASLTNAVDTMLVGRALGPRALSAVGWTVQPRLMLLCPFFALSTAVTAAVARLRGEGSAVKAPGVLKSGLMLAFFLALPLTAAAYAWAEPILRLAGNGRAGMEELMPDAAAYFRLTALALPLSAGSLCVCAALRGAGESRTPLWINLCGSLVNTLLHAALISGRLGFPGLGIRGAAWGVAAGGGTAFTLAVFAVMAGGALDVDLRCRSRKRRAARSCSLGRGGWLDRASLRLLLPVWGSTALEQGGLRLGYFLAGRSLFSLGASLYAAHQICMQWQNLSFSLGDGLGAAATALVGRRAGKGRMAEAARMGGLCRRFALISSLVFGGLTLMLRQPMAALFLRPGEADAAAVTAAASEALLALGLVQLFQTQALALAGALRGAGEHRFVMVASALCVSLIRPALTAGAVAWFGRNLALVWLVSSAETALRCGLFWLRFRRGRWRRRKNE